ncbi:MAG TPA: hypothetical protein VK578_03290 [Edaphobacter sp.]|nr:hypothetical protein [Edaphobacter sp.]
MSRPYSNILTVASLVLFSAVLAAQASEDDTDYAQLPKFRDLMKVGTQQRSPDGTQTIFKSFPDSQPGSTGEFYLGVNQAHRGAFLRFMFPGDTDFQHFPEAGILFPADQNMILLRLAPVDASLCPKVHPVLKHLDLAAPSHASPPVDYAELCDRYLIYTRDLIPENGPDIAPAFVVTADGLEVSPEIPRFSADFNNANYTVNDASIKPDQMDANAAITGWIAVHHFMIVRYPAKHICTLYKGTYSDYFNILRPGPGTPNLTEDNGIAVAPAKVFDNFTLRQMLASTSAQLASISGFNQTSLVGALSNIQGVTRDTSYLSAQVTTVAPPSVTSTAVNGGTASNTLANTFGVNNGTTSSNSTITCPPGTLPGIGTSGLPACAAVVAGTATVGSTGAGNNSGGASTSTTQQVTGGTTQSLAANAGATSNQQNTVTTTNAGQAGVVASAPVSTAFAAPTNLGLSASDMLAEQV